MEDLIIHLRGGQRILIRVDKCTWRRDPVSGGLHSLDLTHPEPITETHQLNWVRLEAIDAIETRPVSNTPPNAPRCNQVTTPALSSVHPARPGAHIAPHRHSCQLPDPWFADRKHT